MFHPNLINHPERFALDESRIHELCEKVSEEVNIPQRGIINIAFLSDEEIRALNQEYRGIDRATDVLSFHYFDDFGKLSADDIAGEIILSEFCILKQAVEHGHSPEKESQILVIHGLLHILGYDHETDEEYEEMWKYESVLRQSL